MSHAVMRGAPTLAQLHLDGIIAELVEETGRQEDRYCLNKILFKCLRDNPADIRLVSLQAGRVAGACPEDVHSVVDETSTKIEGSTGEVDTNRVVLERSVRTALALQDAGLKPGDTVLVVSSNSLEMAGLYFGGIFAGVVLCFLPPIVIAYELKHFLNILPVKMLFIEEDILPVVDEVLQEKNLNIDVVFFGKNTSSKNANFEQFVNGFDEQIKDYWPVDTDRDAGVIVLPTSGSTGMPKAAIWNNRGMVAQLPTLWAHNIRFPKPTGIYMCTSNASWATYNMAMTSSAVFGVTVLITTAKATTDHVRMLLRKYKPTVTLMSVSTGSALVTEPGLRPGDLSSFDVIYLCGSAVPEHTLRDIKVHLRDGGRAHNLYGLTEMQGTVIMQKHDSPASSLGTIVNQIEFKVVDEHGNKLGPNKPGELWLKSDQCTFKEYANNDKATKESFSEDGWFKTGDKVYADEHQEIFFVERIKFIIKYQSYQISPSELEEIITQVEGVHSAAVCDSPKGPAALVATLPDQQVAAQDIHNAIKSTLSDVKHLRGGVAFVETIPLSANGKIDRNKVKEMFNAVMAEDTPHIYYDC